MESLKRCYAADLKLTDIQIEGRFRVDYGDMDEFCASFKTGQLERICVKEMGDGKYKLLAGGRRCKAAELIKAETIRADVWPKNMTEREMLWVELEENIRRKNMTWQEEVNLQNKLLTLTKELVGPEDRGREMTILAKTTGADLSTVSRDIKLHQAMKTIPQIAAAPTKRDAIKLLTKMEEAVIHKELAKRAEKRNATTGVDKIRQDILKSFIVGDFFKNVGRVPENCINFIDLDPPYGIDYEDIHSGRADENKSIGEFHEVSEEEYYGFMEKVGKECFRVCTSNAWLVCWCSIWRLDDTFKALTKAGFLMEKSPIIWVKPGNQGRNRNPSTKKTVDYEVALYGRKGNAQLVKQGTGSVYSAVRAAKNIHPTEKPVPLLVDVFKDFVSPGQRIMSPFLGSGNTLLAANLVGAQAFGFDLSEEFKASFNVRLQEHMPPGIKKEDDLSDVEL